MMGTFSQKQSTMNIKNLNSLNGNLGGRPHKIRTFIASLYGDNLQRLADFAASLKAYLKECNLPHISIVNCLFCVFCVIQEGRIFGPLYFLRKLQKLGLKSVNYL